MKGHLRMTAVPRIEPSPRLLLALVALALGGCSRCGTPVNPIGAGFRVDPASQAVDFGRVLEGQSKSMPVTLIAETVAAVDVTASTGAPFEAPVTIHIPGGSQADLPVVFHAGNGPASGELVLTENQEELRVSLTGVGVRPPVCLPSKACVVSSYSLDEDRCVETPSPDDAPCDPGSQCLELGRCRSGACLGVPRSCSDNDVCTSDACAPDAGCVHVPVVCPPPTVACQVAYCRPGMGAGTGCDFKTASDGTPCGSVSCELAHACVAGICVALVPPDGAPCAPPVACLGPGTCQNKQCVRPDAGPWVPAWSAALDGTPLGGRPALLSTGGNLYFTACGLPAPPGPADGGVDAGADGGSDAGASDGGGGDGGLDGGAGDGGLDAGPGRVPDGGVCALLSYTPTGFDRFATPFDEPRTLVQVGPWGVVLRGAGGLELRSRTTGELLGTLDAPVRLRAVATQADAAVLVAVSQGDGGSRLDVWTDAGLVEGAPLVGEPLLAVDELEATYTFDPGSGLLEQRTLVDGGVVVSALAIGAGLDSLAVSRGLALAGGRTAVRFFDDGGALAVPLDWSLPDGGAEPLPRDALLAHGLGTVFYKRCDQPAMSCTDADKSIWLRAFDATTGAMLWESRVAGWGFNAQVQTSALATSPALAVAALVQGELDGGGALAAMEVFSNGKRLLLCPLDAQTGTVRGALFAAGRLFVLARRADGSERLEAYDLTNLPVGSDGWSQDDQVDGTRRAQ